jgi:hypothetical protein
MLAVALRCHRVIVCSRWRTHAPQMDVPLLGSASGGGGGSLEMDTSPAPHTSRAAVEDSVLWQAVHASCIFGGGLTFCAATGVLYYPSWGGSALTSAVFFIIGSCGFLTVDVMEWFTFTADPWLRANIALSAFGSVCYLLGSCGFLPDVYERTDRVGVLGIEIGSAAIGCSQAWKLARVVGASKRPPSAETICASRDKLTAVGLELSAGLGAWCYLAGTLMYDQIPVNDEQFTRFLDIYMLGACCFTLGGALLAYRHAILRIV